LYSPHPRKWKEGVKGGNGKGWDRKEEVREVYEKE